MEASSDPRDVIPGSIRGVRTPYLGLCRTGLENNHSMFRCGEYGNGPLGIGGQKQGKGQAVEIYRRTVPRDKGHWAQTLEA